MVPRYFQPADLRSLFTAFEWLEQGESVALVGEAASRLAEPGISIQNISGPMISVQSSGTTRQPKTVWLAWSKVKRDACRNSRFIHWTWGSPFRAHTFAGLQVALQAWSCGGDVVSLNADWAADWSALRQERVNALSCTPTYVDILLDQGRPTESADLPDLQQITLGGEPLHARVGSRIEAAFPGRHFTVIYATAEFGVISKSHRADGWYDLAPLGVRDQQWRVVDGQLQLFEKGQWQNTGDEVEIGNGLLRVVGRMDAVANVAGTKVSLAEVTELAEEVPGVKRAQAIAARNAITGQIVSLRYSVHPGTDKAAVRQALEGHLRQKLRKEAWPRHWEEMEIPLGPNTKRRVLS